MLWVALTLVAATLQATRNALSRRLVGRVSPALTAWSRFAFNLPFATALAIGLGASGSWPSLSAPFFAWCAAGAVTQLLANVALVAAFQLASFSQSVALHKLEVVFGAAIGLTLFGEVPSALGWAGVFVSTAGVLLMNLARPGEGGAWSRALAFDRGTAYALACAALLAFTSFLLKEALTALAAANPRIGAGRFEPAAHTVFHVAWIQVALATPAVAWMQPGELRRVRALWRTMLGIGATGFLASLCWFWAFGLALVAYVRAVGQLEAPISIAMAALLFRERGLARQLPAIAAIVLGVVLVLLGCAPAARGESEASLRARAARLHRDAIVLDGHNDIMTLVLDYGFDLGMDAASAGRRDATPYWIPVLRSLLPTPRGDEIRTDTDLRRLREGGVDAQFFSIFVDSRFVPEDAGQAGRATRRGLDMLEAALEQVRRHPESLELAVSAAEVRRVAAAGRVAVLLGLEGGHAIEDDLATLRAFHEHGVRYLTLTWNNANAWADSCYERRHGGLTDFGREVVREMNRLGVMVDVSHVSDETFWDAIETTRAPLIASHSSARALAPLPRNLGDDMLRAVARNGGVVMVNFQDVFLDPGDTPPWRALGFLARNLGWPDTPFSMLVDHLEYVARVAGADHVGLGSDFASSFNMPAGMKSVADFPGVTLELLRRGWSEGDVAKLLGGNALRVMEQVESVEREGPTRPAADQRGSSRIGRLSSRPNRKPM